MDNNDDVNNAVCDYCGAEGIEGLDITVTPEGISICKDCAEYITSDVSQADAEELASIEAAAMAFKERDKASKTTAERSKIRDLTPSMIKAELDKRVIGQDAAKKVLSVDADNHYQLLDSMYDDEDVDPELKDVTVEKSNIILTGPTGCGKTLLAKTLRSCWTCLFQLRTRQRLQKRGM